MKARAGSPCVRNGCSACCHETEMPLTRADVARLEAIGHAAADFSRIGDDGFLHLRNDPTRAGGQGAPCFFLHDGLCSVYEHRPAGCRVYPFVLDEGDVVARDVDCPHADAFPADSTARPKLLRILSALEREAVERASDAPTDRP